MKRALVLVSSSALFDQMLLCGRVCTCVLYKLASLRCNLLIAAASYNPQLVSLKVGLLAADKDGSPFGVNTL